MTSGRSEKQTTRSSTERPFKDVLECERVYTELPYPLPWAKLTRAGVSWTVSKFMEHWRKRTWYGRVKLLLSLPLVCVTAVVAAIVTILIEPTVLLIPVLDVVARVEERVDISTPATYVEDDHQ